MKKELVNYPYLSRPISLYTNDNGHKIALAHKEGALINISSWVKTGSINENGINNGVSHFLEHLMFKGTNKYKAGEFDRILEQKGGIINAATWKDYTFYYITISKNSLDLAIELHADMMVDPILPEEEIGPAFVDIVPEEKRERYVVLEEIKMRNDQNWSKVYTKLNNSMYEYHPYKRDVIGTPEIISGISRDEIMDYYKNFYTPENISTIVVGDFDEEQVLNKIVENFKFSNSGCLICANQVHTVPELEIKIPKFIEQKTDVNTGYLMLGFLCDSAKNLKETIALDLISVIFGEGKSSRLNHNLIESVKNPHYYSVESCHYQFKDGDNFFINANFDPEFYGVIVDELKAELEKLKEIDSTELKKAKKQIKVDFASSSETVAKISDNIGYYLTVCEDLNMAQNYEKMLEEIDEKYLQEIVCKYLDSAKCSVSVLLPEKV